MPTSTELIIPSILLILSYENEGYKTAMIKEFIIKWYHDEIKANLMKLNEKNYRTTEIKAKQAWTKLKVLNNMQFRYF